MDVLLFSSTFLLETGILVVVAASLWGLYFSYRAHNEREAADQWGRLARVLAPLLLVGVVMAAVGWFLSDSQDPVQLLFGMILLVLALLATRTSMRKKKTHARLEMINFISLCVAGAAVIIAPWQVLLLAEALALGTVLMTTALYIAVLKRPLGKNKFRDSVPLLVNVLWLGIFLDRGLTFVQFGPQYYYGQSLWIIEGAFGFIILLLAIVGGVLVPMWKRHQNEGTALSVRLKYAGLILPTLLLSSLLLVRSLRAYEIIFLNAREVLAYYVLGTLLLLILVLLPVLMKKR